MSELLYLEDIFVGQRFVTGTHHAGRGRRSKHSHGDYDPQPFHTDEAAAKDSFFGGLAASGWHTAAITMRLQVDSGPPIAGGMIGAGGELSWPRPTRPGDILHVESEVMAVRHRDPNPSAASSPSKAKPKTRMAKWSSFSPPSFWSGGGRNTVFDPLLRGFR